MQRIHSDIQTGIERAKKSHLRTMEQTCSFPKNATYFFISNTHDHDHFLDLFVQGVHHLEDSMVMFRNGKLSSLRSLSDLILQLAIAVKPLSAFLKCSVSHRPTTNNPRPQQLEDMWLRRAVSNLRILCLRYSLVVLDIVRAKKQRDSNAGGEDTGFKTSDIEATYTSRNDLDAGRSAPDLWSCVSTRGSSYSVDTSYHDSNEAVQNWMDDVFVPGDFEPNAQNLPDEALRVRPMHI